jgi:hypothetical protein
MLQEHLRAGQTNASFGAQVVVRRANEDVLKIIIYKGNIYIEIGIARIIL